MTNLFARPIDKKPTLEIIRKVLQGIGQPNFDDGTGIQRQAGITNIVLEDEDFGKKFEGLSIPDMSDMDMSDFNKTKLSFTLPSGDYVAKIAMGEFVLKKKMKGRVASIYEHFNKNDLTVMLSDDPKNDEVAVRSIIEKFIQEDVSLLNGEDESSLDDTVMGITYDGAYCIDRQVGWLLFGFISKQLGLIRPTESNMLIDIFMLGDSAVRFPELESVMRLEMMQTFNILKENGHDVDNEVESNDMDNFLYYVEKGDVQGNVYISQNNMFLVARNTKTDVLKVWNTMRINAGWLESIHDMADIDEDDNTVFNVAEYLQDFTNAKYANQYDYPFEFNADGYRKSVDLLLEEFETTTNDLVYDSEKGYMTKQYMEFNSLAFEISYSNNMMTDEYGVKRDILILTDMDVNSPDYYIRSMTGNFTENRATALYHLFVIGGTGLYWNGQTYVDNYQNILKDYPQNAGENDYSPLKADRAFAFGRSSNLFNLPKDMSPAWRKAVFEMAAYLTDWVIKNPQNEEAQGNIDNLANIFEEYFDVEVFQKVKAAS